MSYASIETVLEEFKKGEFIIIYDEDREVEGDFFVLAENITPQKVNFMFEKAKGMICTACAPEVLNTCDIPLLPINNENPHGTNFCIPVDATENITTGVSAFDRAETIRLLGSPMTKPADFVRPGHCFPLLARDPQKRFGHTEASVEMAKNVGKYPAVAICEILNKDGEKATLEELKNLSSEYNIPMTSLNSIQKFLLS